jgi:hypothetical protein
MEDVTMVLEKKRLNIASESALELPVRETLGLFVSVTIGNILSGNFINVNVANVNVAAQVCTLVSAINFAIDQDINNPLWCSW